MYTSAKDGVNCGLLHRYLLSCLYPDAFPCSDEGQVRLKALDPPSVALDSPRVMTEIVNVSFLPAKITLHELHLPRKAAFRRILHPFFSLSQLPPLPSPNLCVKTSDAVFIPAGWDSKRLIDHLLSPEKTPWGPEATFSDVVVPPPGVERREGASEKRGSWGKGRKSEVSEEKVDMVEPEGNWLSNLSKQFIDEKLQPSEPRRRPKNRSESKVRALGMLFLCRTEAVSVVYLVRYVHHKFAECFGLSSVCLSRLSFNPLTSSCILWIS